MRILITGASGLVGQGALQACLAADDVSAVVLLNRRPSGLQHPKLSELTCSGFNQLAPLEDRLQGFDACLYCAGAPPLGTPEAEYRHVTLELTVHVAGVLARHSPRHRFIYVSGAHADPDSRLMPLRIKGQTEQALQSLPIRSVMLRPGGVQPVQGVQSPHPRMRSLYRLGAPLMGIGVRLLPSVMTTTERLGLAMLAVARMSDPPAVVENATINALGTTEG